MSGKQESKLMLISIVIPAYNEESYLPKTLKSLQGQVPNDFSHEIIVVDACSEDKTAEVANSFEASVLKVERKSVAFARQKGVEKAKGEIVVCIDADTIVPQDLLKTITSEYKKADDLVGLTGIVDGWGGNFLQRFFYKWVSAAFIGISFLLGKPGFQGQSFSFRKEAFLKIGGFNTRLYTGEDLDLGNRLSKIGKIKFLPKVVGVSSLRRFKEGVFKTVGRGFLSYLAVVWKIRLGHKEKEPFPAIR